MAQRGRKSAKLLTIIGPHGIEPVKRPDPPVWLNEEAAEEWRNVVGALAADYFRPETRALLEQHCRHVIACRRLGHLIELEEAKGEEFDAAHYQGLLRALAGQTYALAVTDSKLRLTPEAVYDRSESKPTAKARPWTTT